jgi:3-dehydroquinate synthase
MKIYLTGFMGSGKTTVGKILAKKLGFDFIDTDELIVKKAKKSIPRIFKEDGEKKFRKTETQIVKSIGAIRRLPINNTVVSLGGGAILEEENLEIILKSGRLVHLHISPEEVWKRLKNDKRRPLLTSKKKKLSKRNLLRRINWLIEIRKRYYEYSEFSINTTGKSPEKIADEITEKIFKIETVKVSPKNKTYPVYLGAGILEGFGEIYFKNKLGKKCVVITNKIVDKLHGKVLYKSLENNSINYEKIIIQDGEKYKNIETANKIYTQMLKLKCDRNTTVLAFGGGVIEDLAGFIASTFMRGVPLVHIPTTLLAQVDSSIGGKVGVNHKLAKNIIGAFYQPEFVFIDTELLRTLPKREFINGLGEVIKYGIIKDKKFFEFIENNLYELLNLNSKILKPIIKKCCEIKAEIVRKDEKEAKLRMILNFGHTVGHALETITNYNKYKHGEAVMFGMITAGKIAVKLGYLDLKEFERIEKLIKRINPIVDIIQKSSLHTKTQINKLLKTIALDKKVKNGKIRFILPLKIGEVRIFDNINFRKIFSVINKLTISE